MAKYRRVRASRNKRNTMDNNNGRLLGNSEQTWGHPKLARVAKSTRNKIDNSELD